MSAAVVSPEAKRNHEALSPSHSPAAVAATTTTTPAAVPRSMEKKSVSRSPAAQVGGNGAPSVVVSATEESTSDVECVSPPHGAPALLGAAGRAAADGRSPVSATPSVAFAPSSSLMSKAVPTVDSGSSGAGTTATDTIAARPSAPKGGGKKMLQATLSFTDGHVEAQLRKDLGDRDARLEELQNKVRELESVLEGHEAARHDAELHIDELDQRLGRYKDTVKQLMIDVARTQRREARRWQHQQHFELGHIASTHNPISGVQEAWVNGNQWRRLNAALGDVHARQREVEASKKGAARPRVGSKAAAAADDDSSMLDVEEEAEMRRMEIAALKTQEQQIMMQLAQFEQDKEAFVKEVRRIHDEDSSPFALRETIGPIATAASDGNTSALLPQPLNSAPGAEKWQERYVLIQLLGRGGFSEVWKAFDLEEGRFVACKVHKVNRTWNHAAQKNYLKHAERELAIQQSLDHPRLMKLYDVFQMDSNTFVSVMEYGAGEDLEKRLKRCRQLREADAKLILMQILSALRHLSEQDQPVIHYDLKPANIIFHSPLPTCMEIKVTDFGLSKVIQDAAQGPSNDPSVELTSQQCGTFWYLPPECFSSGAKISHKVDIWAAGIIFYQMLYGVRPFAANASQADVFNQKLIVSAARKGVDFPAKPVVSDDAKKIITKCLTFDVAGRPDIFQLCADPYFHSRGKRPRATQAATLALPSQPNPGQPRPPQPSGLNDQMPPPS